MKKKLIGLLVLGSVSCFAGDYEDGYNQAVRDLGADLWSCSIENVIHEYKVMDTESGIKGAKFSDQFIAEGLGRGLALEKLLKVCNAEKHKLSYSDKVDGKFEDWTVRIHKTDWQKSTTKYCKATLRNRLAKCISFKKFKYRDNSTRL